MYYSASGIHPIHISELFDIFFSMDTQTNIEENFKMASERVSIPKFPVSNHYIQEDHSYTIELAVTGIPEDKISIETEGDTLIIKSEGYQRVEDGKRRIICQNLPYRGFEQKFPCSPMMDLENLEATIKYGVLTIVIPRKEASMPKKKEIKIG